MKKFISICTVLVILLASCKTYDATVNHTYPFDGTTNNVNIVTKDFESLGIIFLSSIEMTDTLGNHTGSKITHEMFMREAAKLQADDVINIKIDITQKKEKIVLPEGISTIVTTYTYKGTALAIKYTTAVSQNENRVIDRRQDYSTATVIPKEAIKKESGSKTKNALIFSGVLLAIGGAYLTAAFL